MWKVIRRAGGMHSIGNTPAPHELHRAGVDRSRSRMVRQAIPLLDQNTRGPAHPEIQGKRKSNGAAADDQNRGFQIKAG
jgi:hypothetical protein